MLAADQESRAAQRAAAEQLGERIAEQAAHLEAATHRLLTDIRAFDQSGAWYRQGFRTCAQWLSWRIGWGRGVSREHVRVANRLAELPLVDDALRRGVISYSKVRAITRVATAANEEVLVGQAEFTTGSQMEKICAKYAAVVRGGKPRHRDDAERRYVKRRDLLDGMVRIEAVLFAEEAASLWAALDRIATELCRAKGAGEAAGRRRDPGAIEIANHVGIAASQPVDGSTDTSRGTTDEPASADLAGDDRTETSLRTCASAGSTVTEPASFAKTLGHLARGCAEHGSAETHDHLASGCAEHGSAETHDRLASGCAEHGSAETHASQPDEGTGLLHMLLRSEIECESDADADAADTSGRAATIIETRSCAAAVDVAPAATSRQVIQRGVAFQRADAIVAMAEAVLRGKRRERAPIDVMLSVSTNTLTKPRLTDPLDAACFADGTCISAETARRLCCDAGLTEVVEDEDGNAVSIGRKRRTIPGAMKRALLRRDETCRFPGCTARVFLEGHHMRHWADGGETKTSNLVLCCHFHHHFVHEYGYTVEADPTHGFVFRDDQGRVVAPVPAPARPERCGWDTIQLQNRDLDISVDKLPPGWNGEPVNWPYVIDDLVRADRLT